MALSFLVPNRTVLLVTDEALTIYSVTTKGARLVEIVPWNAENFEENVASIISKDCGGKPILVVNDMVEQHYRKEKIMRAGVGVLDRASMLKRKLNVAFPNYPVRAAYALNEKAPKGEKKKGSDIYIFAAIPESKQFAKTIGATAQSLATVSGFCLLPVEASDMVKTLSAKLSKEAETKPKWSIFIGQHKNGSLRQIVIKDGDLALTRMTPIIDSDNDAQAWASEVFQEFRATMSYITRFGYQPEDGLNVIVISNASPGSALQSLIDQPCNFYSLTTGEAARLLNIPLGPQEDFRHADTLHVTWIGRKTKFLLQMKAQQIDEVSQPRKMALAASFLLVCGAAFLFYQLFNSYSALSGTLTDLEDAQARLAQLNVQYQKEVQRKEELGFDIRLVQSSIAVHDSFEKEDINTLPFFSEIGEALGKDLRIDRIVLEKNIQTGIVDQIVSEVTQDKPLYTARMLMTYPSTTDIDRGNKEVSDLRDRLQGLLPDHNVEVTKFLKDYEYVEEIVVETGDLQKKDIEQDFIAEIVIKGPMKND